MAGAIKRKPLPNASTSVYPAGGKPENGPSEQEESASIDRCPESDPFEEGTSMPDLDEQLNHLQPETGDNASHDQAIGVPTTTNNVPGGNTSKYGTKADKLKTVLGEVKHFAGGLVAHPYEATKHHSILRHSHGLLFYHGPTTRVAITIFSDQVLSPNRTLWLQKKGYSGTVGLKAGSLGTRSAWINVTPAFTTTPDRLPQDDERAWQRDINKFLKKAKDVKSLRDHRAIETDIIRVPHVAEDGYFRIVLCSGRKVLCPSPVFRYASSSTDPSRIRGASLSTLPMELGIELGSFVTNLASQGAIQPVTDYVSSIAQPYEMDGLTPAAAQVTYDASGTADRVDSLLESADANFDEKQQAAYSRADQASVVDWSAEQINSGPDSPYPLRMTGKIVSGTGSSQKRLGFPTANLANVAEDTLLRLDGFYLAWAQVTSSPMSTLHPKTATDSGDWYTAIVMISTQRDYSGVIERKAASVYFVHDFLGINLVGQRLHVLLMGFLHASEGSSTMQNDDLFDEASHERMVADIITTQDILGDPAWGASAALEQVETNYSVGSFSERLSSARQTGQRQLSRLQLEKLGFRTGFIGDKDRLIGTGGTSVPR